MDILIFLVGFIIGGISVGIIFNLNHKNNEEKDKLFASQMQLQFENLTNKIFKETSEDFSAKNKEKLEEFFSKFKEKIEDFERRNEFNLKNENEKFTQFDTNIKSFIEEGNKISHYTTSLVNVMKSDNRRQGSGGEIVLARVLEASGLREGEEYSLQKATSEGRPDASVFLPQGRRVDIDAKTSISSWEAYVNAQSDEEKENFLKEFSDSTKKHITGLAGRNYTAEDGTVDYVLMFIPIESCYSLLFCEDNKLWDFAWKNNIMPVSPSTLLAALKIINKFHTVSRQNKNAVEISRICTKMLDKFADMLNDMLKARKSLISALTKLNGRDNILTNIEKLDELGATINKELPKLPDDVLQEIETQN